MILRRMTILAALILAAHVSGVARADGGDSGDTCPTSGGSMDEYVPTEEESVFYDWAISCVDEFWNNGLLDFLPFLPEDEAPSEVPYGDPPNETSGGGVTIPIMPYDPENPCGRSHGIDVTSVMYINPFNKWNAYRSYLGNPLFPARRTPTGRLAFLEVCNQVNALGDTGNPAEPANWTARKFRTAADLSMTVTVQDGKFTDFYYDFAVRGGPEPTPLGALHGKVKGKITKVEATPEKITVEYVHYGRPHLLAEIPMGNAGMRTCKWIWHHVRVELTPVWCDDVISDAWFITESAFPTHLLYLNGTMVDFKNQTTITTLWQSMCGSCVPVMPGWQHYVSNFAACPAVNPPLPANPETDPAHASSQ